VRFLACPGDGYRSYSPGGANFIKLSHEHYLSVVAI
jgi:hypothetical protein